LLESFRINFKIKKAINEIGIIINNGITMSVGTSSCIFSENKKITGKIARKTTCIGKV
tara:strand:- start:382 stop:555 length:174 start_codon:yes stop_codon:yes gene_type:complete